MKMRHMMPLQTAALAVVGNEMYAVTVVSGRTFSLDE